MRIKPTALEQSGTAGDYRVTDATGGGVTCSAVPSHEIATTAGAVALFTVSSGLAAGNATLGFNVGTNGFLGWSAEL